jgi:hypothetical protein
MDAKVFARVSRYLKELTKYILVAMFLADALISFLTHVFRFVILCTMFVVVGVVFLS